MQRHFMTVAAVASFASLVAVPARAQAPDRAPTVLAVDVSTPVKAVDHAASGSLYGVGDQGWPPDAWIAPTRPKMFTQPPPGATHQPNGEPAPVGDTLKVWRTAARNGAVVTIRMPDIFPSFPYVWQGDDYWSAQVANIVRAKLASGGQ